MVNKTMFDEPIGVLGAGSWGTALSKLLSDRGQGVLLWARKPEHANAIQKERENSTYLPGYRLTDKVFATADLKHTVRSSRALIIVVPSHGFRKILEEIRPDVKPDTFILSATKGIENETLYTMSQIMREILPFDCRQNIAVLMGPSFAKEVAEEMPTAVTVGSERLDVALYFQKILSSERFRVYTSTDMVGLEFGGAIKNIIAIAAGISDGLRYGTNTRAALITRGLAEIIRLGTVMGANPMTFSGLGGLGDLILTCTGDLSRNRSVGLMLGQGQTLGEIMSNMKMVAEGIKTTKSVYCLAKRHNVEMPITEQVYQVLYLDKSPRDAVRELLTRDLKEELGPCQ